jgi:zinc transporter ZupT
MMLNKLPFIFIFGWLCHHFGEPVTKTVFPKPKLNRIMSYGEGGLMIWVMLEFMITGMNFDKHQRNKITASYLVGISALGLGVLVSFIWDALFCKQEVPND